MIIIVVAPTDCRSRQMLGVLSLYLLLTAGCSSPGGADTDSVHVIAGFYPFAYVAERVADENATVTNLTNPGVEPHDLELTLRQVTELGEADLVIYAAGFQPTIDEAIAQNPPQRVLEASNVSLEGEGDAHQDVSLEGDPHLWQDPTMLIPIAEQLARDLADADPDHADDYMANAAALTKDLHQLDRDFMAGLANCQRRDIVTSHAAFGYLADRYDLTMIAIAGLSPDAEPSLEHLAEIQDLVESRNITTVFSETLGSKQYAETLAEDLGVTAAVLDPVEGLEDEESNEHYLSLMHNNLEVLQEANSCT